MASEPNYKELFENGDRLIGVFLFELDRIREHFVKEDGQWRLQGEGKWRLQEIANSVERMHKAYKRCADEDTKTLKIEE